MPTKDFSSNRLMRSLQQRTARRRGHGRQRKRTVALITLGLTLLLALAAPSLLCNTTLGRSILLSSTDHYGWQAEVEAIEFGWITPLKLRGLKLEGASGETHADIAELATEWTLLGLLRGTTDFGHVILEGVQLDLVVVEGGTSLERDLEPLLASAGDSGDSLGTIELFDADIQIGDQMSQQIWRASQVQAKILRRRNELSWEANAVLTDPQQASGALRMACKLPWTVPAAGDVAGWSADLQLNGVPLYLFDLLKRRFPEATTALPASLQGDATGGVQLLARGDGEIEATFRQLELRQLAASDPRLGDRRWTNQLATVSGQLHYTADALVGKKLKATTDFGGATVSGRFANSLSSSSPLAWFEAIDGTAVLEVDLPSLAQAAPGLLPLRPGAEIVSGKVRADVVSGQGPDQVYRSNWTVRCEPLRATAAGRTVLVEPVEAAAVWRLREGHLSAEELRLRSEFGTASGQGNLRAGRGQFNVDFARLTSILRPVFELPEASFEGRAGGELDWTTTPDGQWRMQGNAQAENVVIGLPAGAALRPGALTTRIEASGRWANETLSELTAAQAVIEQPEKQTWEVRLSAPVQQPRSDALFPIEWTGNGELTAASQLLGPWLPAELHSLAGQFRLTANSRLALGTWQLRQARIELNEPRIGWKKYVFRQPFTDIQFEGEWSWPAGTFSAEKASLAAQAVSMAVEGSSSPEASDLFVSWRANLERCQKSIEILPAVAPPRGSVAAATEAPGWQWQGACEGRAQLKARDAIWEIDTDASATQLALRQPPPTSAASGFVGPSRPGQSNAWTPRTVWAEPHASVRGMIRYDARSGGALADAVHVTSDWLSTDLSGQVIWNEQVGKVELEGPSQIAMDVVAQRLSELLGQPIELEGTQQSPLQIAVDRKGDGSLAMGITTDLGWQRGSIAGVPFGKSRVPVRLTETTVFVERAAVPIGNGRLNVAGEVHYRPGPLWFEQQPGRFAENIELRPEMTRTWLKYLAPLAADVSEISGTFDMELDEALVVVDDLHRSRVSGRMQVQQAQMDAGPLAQQVLTTVDTVKSLARGLQGPPQPSGSRRLVTWEPQTVDFALQNGVVTHQRLFMTIDNARLVTSGAVGLNGQLDLLAQLPLQASWLGTDLQGLAGQNISLPIRGTLASPRLDSSGLARMAQQLGSQAIRQTAENVLQEQLNRGMQRLFGR